MTRPARVDGVDDDVDLIDLIGGQLELVARADAPNADAAILRGAVAPGAGVPLNSHADFECFHVIAGRLDVFIEPHGWTMVEAGRSAVVARGERHALRNATDTPVEPALVTTNRMVGFFREAGTVGTRGALPGPPTPEKIRHLLAVAGRDGYWMASPAEHGLENEHLQGLCPWTPPGAWGSWTSVRSGAAARAACGRQKA